MVGRLFSEAPTVNTFLAVAGLARLSRSISPSELASVPSLAAAKMITNSSYVLALSSACIELVVYSPLTELPQELVWTLEPLAQANLNMSSKSSGMPTNASEPPTVVAIEWNNNCAPGAAPIIEPLLSVPSPRTEPATCVP